MNTKEAIEFLKRYENLELYSDMGYTNEVNEVIALLQQGERYRLMWFRFKKWIGNQSINDELLNKHNKKIQILMKEWFEQKYFPKETSDYKEGEE